MLSPHQLNVFRLFMAIEFPKIASRSDDVRHRMNQRQKQNDPDYSALSFSRSLPSIVACYKMSEFSDNPTQSL